MSWITPVVTWVTSKFPTTEDFNRIEGNTDYLKDVVDVLEDNGYADNSTDQSTNTGSSVTFNTVNTGQGDNNLYDMNQNVKTTSSPTFATVNTGQGDNNLYDMNQNVKTTSGVTFGNIKVSESAYIHGETTSGAAFTALSVAVPTVGDECQASGGVGLGATGNLAVSRLKRFTSTVIYCYGTLDSSVALTSFTSGSSTDRIVSIATGIKIV